MVGVPFRQEQSSLLVACSVSAAAILGNGGMKKELDHRGAFRHSHTPESPRAPPCYPQNSMPTEHIVALLIAERDKLNRAIEALQGSAKRRGRPPKDALTATTAPAKKPKRQSAARRKAQADRMKAYWAAKRKKAK
jgi:hypothetical protein